MLGPRATEDQVAQLRTAYGLDQPLYVQYVTWLGRVVRGDLGESIQLHRPVLTEVGERFRGTLILAIAAMLISFNLGIVLGVAAAVRANGADKVAEAKVLFDKAHDALDEGDFARAFELADASLKQRKTARTYLLRAQAQQRLDRIDDALASIDAATQLAPGFATVWEMRGRILWAARRRDEARAAFEKFLELDPNGPKAAAVRRLMDEPR